MRTIKDFPDDYQCFNGVTKLNLLRKQIALNADMSGQVNACKNESLGKVRQRDLLNQLRGATG